MLIILQVVGSVKWPLASRYKAVVRTQSPKAEMITSLFSPEEEGGKTVDRGIIRLVDQVQKFEPKFQYY